MKKLQITSYTAAQVLLHGVVTLQGVAVAGENGPAGGTAVIFFQCPFQPALDRGEVPADKKVLEELLRQVDGVGAAKAQDFLRMGIHLKGHVKGAVDIGNGVVGIGAGLADDKVIAVGCVFILHGRHSFLFLGEYKRGAVTLTVWRRTDKKSRTPVSAADKMQPRSVQDAQKRNARPCKTAKI